MLAFAGLAVALATCGTTSRLPQNTRLDSRHHLLASSNFQSEEVERTRLIVTGVPEGPNKISNSTHSYLDDFFAGQNHETACGQIYAPSVLGRLGGYRGYLQQALGKARGAVDLLVYSAGALSLMGLPKDYWDEIRSLTFVSPVVGRETISPGGGPLQKIAVVLMGFRTPSADRYMSSIAELLEHLLAAGVIVKVSLGREDTILNNSAIADSFSTYNRERTRIPVETTNRPHGLTSSQVNRLFAEACTGQSQPGKDL